MRTLLLVATVAVTACEGDTEPTTGELTYYTTCGDPACQGYTGPFEGVDLCIDQVPGDACSEEGAQCDPEDGCNARVICATEDPKEQEGGCPISKRAAKTDIAYLDEAGLRKAADEALSMKLATWRYRSDGTDSTHLGFVIDDHPTSPAVRPDGERVDLYGYASLALAAAQAQQAELDALKTQVAALQAQLEVCATDR